MQAACVNSDPWEMPSGGVHFEGGWNFGSALYDAMMDGIHVEVVVCDECLKVASSVMKREMKKVHTPEKSVLYSR
jgi:hypothetical protein